VSSLSLGLLAADNQKDQELSPCRLNPPIASSPTQLWTVSTVTDQHIALRPEGPGPWIFEPVPKANVTLISTPMPMLTFNDRLKSRMSACPQASDDVHGRRDCYSSSLFWVPFDLQTSVACNSVTYALNREKKSCVPHVLANVLFVPGLAPENRRIFPESDGCTVVSQYSQKDACSQEYSSIHELSDIHEPFDELPTNLPKAKWCYPCDFMLILDGRPLTATNFLTNPGKTCTVDLIKKGILNPFLESPASWLDDSLKLGIDVYFFPPSDDSRDLCATVPTLSYLHGTNSSQLPSFVPNKHNGLNRSIITMGKTMYEGTVYMRFKTVGALLPRVITSPIYATTTQVEGLHGELWAEVQEEHLFTMRSPDMNMGEVYRSYQANLGASSLTV
jgi:hypothetical protein